MMGDSAIMVGGSGRIVPPGDVGALREAIEGTVGLPDSALAELKAAARRQIAKFNIKAAVDAYDALYRELASSPADAASPAPA